jgi:hypothetical protein
VRLKERPLVRNVGRGLEWLIYQHFYFFFPTTLLKCRFLLQNRHIFCWESTKRKISFMCWVQSKLVGLLTDQCFTKIICICKVLQLCNGFFSPCHILILSIQRFSIIDFFYRSAYIVPINLAIFEFIQIQINTCRNHFQIYPTAATAQRICLKGHWHETSVSSKQVTLSLQYDPLTYLKISDRPFKSYDF